MGGRLGPTAGGVSIRRRFGSGFHRYVNICVAREHGIRFYTPSYALVQGFPKHRTEDWILGTSLSENSNLRDGRQDQGRNEIASFRCCVYAQD